MQLPRSNEAWFLILFFALALAGTLVVVWPAIENTEGEGGWKVVQSIGSGMEWVVVVSGGFSYTAVEAWSMLAEKFKQRQRKAGRQEGRQEATEEVLSLLDEDTRRDVERKLRTNQSSRWETSEAEKRG